jgi:hypothetical protein
MFTSESGGSTPLLRKSPSSVPRGDEGEKALGSRIAALEALGGIKPKA